MPNTESWFDLSKPWKSLPKKKRQQTSGQSTLFELPKCAPTFVSRFSGGYKRKKRQELLPWKKVKWAEDTMPKTVRLKDIYWAVASE